ncbi:MAG: hypothetical protein HRT88_05540 [Lentisphaeraceae bacterium]|nr:hypothetical protein [Lentisphaeraceae bacterium]
MDSTDSKEEKIPPTPANTPVEEQGNASSQTTANENKKSLNCPQCSRPLCQKNGQCYYCGEPDAETIKNLKFTMLDWQRDEALDKEGKKRDKIIKVITFFHMLVASSCVAMTFVADFPPNLTKWFYLFLGLCSAVSATKFTQSAMTLILTVILHIGIAISFFHLAMSSLKLDLMITAGISGVVTGFAATISAAITLQILKNKTLEL